MQEDPCPAVAKGSSGGREMAPAITQVHSERQRTPIKVIPRTSEEESAHPYRLLFLLAHYGGDYTSNCKAGSATCTIRGAKGKGRDCPEMGSGSGPRQFIYCAGRNERLHVTDTWLSMKDSIHIFSFFLLFLERHRTVKEGHRVHTWPP